MQFRKASKKDKPGASAWLSDNGNHDCRKGKGRPVATVKVCLSHKQLKKMLKAANGKKAVTYISLWPTDATMNTPHTTVIGDKNVKIKAKFDAKSPFLSGIDEDVS